MLIRWIALCAGAAHGLLQVQNNTFNSTFRLTQAQIKAANLSDATAHNVEVALNFERSNNAGSLIQDDPFYSDLPEGVSMWNLPPPGTILKVEENTNISLYTLPNSLSMSRFLYTSEALNGSSVLASASILWPYLPRKFSNLTTCDGDSSGSHIYPIVGLAHGTSGQTQACAPSGLRALWDDYHNPFPLALAGYAVVAPDYAGLGVPNGPCPYFILPAQANDLFHAIAAAQSAWPDMLSEKFVLAGQSQGAAVTWAAAQRQAIRPVKGYLGTIAASPFTDVLQIIAADNQAQNNGRVAGIAQGLNSVLPDFQLSDWLTDAGIARWELLHEIKGCGVTGGQLWSAEGGTIQLLKDGWNETSAAKWYSKIMNGNKPFAGPMLVVQGTIDPNANEPVNTRIINETCALYPDSQLQYLRYTNITHVPVLLASQHTFLDWIKDRFDGVEVPCGCQTETYSPPPRVNGAAFAGFNGGTFFIEYDVYGI